MHPSDKRVQTNFLNRVRRIEEERKIQFPLVRKSVSVGSIYDCSRKTFEQALKDKDPDLYVGWNPWGNDGHGHWEIWINPTKKTPVYKGEFEGCKIYALEYVDNGFSHLITTLPFLDLNRIADLQRMDKFYAQKVDDAYVEELDRKEQARTQQIREYLRDHKSEMRDFKEYVRSGYDPSAFFTDVFTKK